MAEPTTYTFAQLRAFEWLPKDGGWRIFDMDECVPATMLGVWETEIRETASGELEYRLTPSGIAERKRLVEMGEIK